MSLIEEQIQEASTLRKAAYLEITQYLQEVPDATCSEIAEHIGKNIWLVDRLLRELLASKPPMITLNGSRKCAVGKVQTTVVKLT